MLHASRGPKSWSRTRGFHFSYVLQAMPRARLFSKRWEEPGTGDVIGRSRCGMDACGSCHQLQASAHASLGLTIPKPEYVYIVRPSIGHGQVFLCCPELVDPAQSLLRGQSSLTLSLAGLCWRGFAYLNWAFKFAAQPDFTQDCRSADVCLHTPRFVVDEDFDTG